MQTSLSTCEIIARMRYDLNPKELLTLLNQISSDKANNFFRNKEYKEAANEYTLLAKAYYTAFDIIDKSKLSDLKPIADGFVETAKYWDKKAADSHGEVKKDFAIREARALTSRGLYDQALKSYEIALSSESITDNSYIWNEKGNINFYLKKLTEAISCYDNAIMTNPTYPEAWFNKGLSLYNLGKYFDSIKCFQQATYFRPDYAEAWLNLGLVHRLLGNPSEALECMNKATKIKSEYPEAWLNKGLVHYSLSQYAEAIKSYDEALRLDGKYYEAWLNKGLSLHNKAISNYEEAVRCYRQALILRPYSFTAKANLAEALLLWSGYIKSKKIAANVLADSEKTAFEVLASTEDETLRYVMSLVLICSYYLRQMPKATEAVMDLIKYYESLPLRFEINWLFDGLLNMVKNSGLGQNERDVLTELVNLSKVNTQSEKGTIESRISVLLSKGVIKNITKRLRVPSSNKVDDQDKDIQVVSTSSLNDIQRGRYDWQIHIEAPSGIMSAIDRVRYTLHPAFLEPIKIISTRDNGFRLEETAIAEFQVKVDIFLAGGKKILTKYHWLRLDSEVNRLHKTALDLVLKGKVSEFNELRNKNEQLLLNFDLSGVDLSGCDLVHIDLNQIRLIGSNLSKSSLDGAELNHADLSNASLNSADLSHSNMSSANLLRSSLLSAKMLYTNLSASNLSYSCLRYADLSYADLSQADLSYADLSQADLSYADLSQARLTSSLIIGVKGYESIKCNGADFRNSFIDRREFIDYLAQNNARNIPTELANTYELEERYLDSAFNDKK